MRNSFLIGAAAAGLLAVAACTSHPGTPTQDAWLAKVYESYNNLDTEAVSLPAARGRAVREGNELVLTLEGGHTLTLHSDIAGCADGNVHCDGYRLVADLPDRHSYLVNEYYYEGGDYWLINDRSGRKLKLDSVPQFSSDNRYFLIQDDDVASDHENDLEIWRRDRDGAVREWGISLTPADTGVSQSFGPPHTSLVSWQEGRIILRFSIGRHLEGATLVAERQWTGTITRAADGWHLEARAPR